MGFCERPGEFRVAPNSCVEILMNRGDDRYPQRPGTASERATVAPIASRLARQRRRRPAELPVDTYKNRLRLLRPQYLASVPRRRGKAALHPVRAA